MIFTHLPHSAPTSAHRSSWKVRGLPTLIPFVTTGAQSLRTSPVVMTAGSVPDQRTQPSVLGPKNPAGLFAAQGQLESRERADVGLPKARGAGEGRAQFEEPERHSKPAAGRVAADPFVVAARGAQPPPPARARLRQERTLSLVLKVAASSAPSPG